MGVNWKLIVQKDQSYKEDRLCCLNGLRDGESVHIVDKGLLGDGYGIRKLLGFTTIHLLFLSLDCGI